MYISSVIVGGWYIYMILIRQIMFALSIYRLIGDLLAVVEVDEALLALGCCC